MKTDYPVLVIGAGPSGLAAARVLKARGIPYQQVEREAGVGGNWRHGVYRDVHIVSSRRTTEFPEWPMPTSYPDFPSAAQMLRYMEGYAQHFGLHDALRVNTEVMTVTPDPAGWLASFADASTARYRAVVVANGHHWARRWPELRGEFHGEFYHAKDYRGPEQLRDRRVLVIGAGNSGCDIVSAAARHAREAHLSLRRGYWFLPKTVMGHPLVESPLRGAPVWLQRLLLRGLLAVVVGDYRNYGLPAPDHRLFEHHPTMNDELLHHLRHGRIQVHGEPVEAEGECLCFADGERLAVDTVICATGYHLRYPMLAPGLVTIRGAVPEVLAGMVVPGQRQLYLLGWGQPRYGIGPLISPSAALLCDFIALQDRLTEPLGTLLTRAGFRPPRTQLLDAGAVLRELRWGRRLLPVLAWLGERETLSRPMNRETGRR